MTHPRSRRPRPLAARVGRDTGKYSAEDARRVMVFRLRRALGYDDEREGDR